MTSTHDDEVTWLKAKFASITNKADWARQHQLKGGPSMLSQHLSGHRPLSMDAAITYAAAFGVPLSSISPRLARLQERATAVSQRSGGRATTPKGRQPSGTEVPSPRAMSLALRLDALSDARRSRAFALVDLTLRTIEAEEASAKTNARSRSA